LIDCLVLPASFLLRRLVDVVTLPQNTGAVRKLYNSEAREIKGCDELTPDGNYIATGSFKGSIKHVRRRCILLAEQLGAPPPLWHDEAGGLGLEDDAHDGGGVGLGSDDAAAGSSGKLPPIHRVSNKSTAPSPSPLLAGTGRATRRTKLPSVGRAKPVDAPDRLDASLVKFDKKRERLVAKTHNPAWLQSLWESLRDRWTPSESGPAVCLSSLVAHMAKVEPLLDMPYAWEYAFDALLRGSGARISMVIPSNLGSVIEASVRGALERCGLLCLAAHVSTQKNAVVWPFSWLFFLSRSNKPPYICEPLANTLVHSCLQLFVSPMRL
jgi:hypothetical protein